MRSGGLSSRKPASNQKDEPPPISSSSITSHYAKIADCPIRADEPKTEDHDETSRRRFLHLAAGAAALPAVSRFAWAQSYPSKPVRVIVPFAPAGNTDFIARLIGQWLNERLGQPFIVDNRPGAGTNIGTEAAVRAPADGYTLLIVTPPSAINATLYETLNFNFIRDIAPVAGVIRAPFVMEINPSVPAKTVPEFIAHAKANPGKISMGSAGIGSGPHVAGELFKMMASVDMVHVPYRGTGPALTDLIGGQVQVYFDGLPDSIEHIKAGKLRAQPGANTLPSARRIAPSSKSSRPEPTGNCSRRFHGMPRTFTLSL